MQAAALKQQVCLHLGSAVRGWWMRDACAVQATRSSIVCIEHAALQLSTVGQSGFQRQRVFSASASC